jgi:hypothetical protein
MRPEQEQIAAWLEEQSAILHAAYILAVQLLSDLSVPGRAQIICHTGRDLCTGLLELRDVAKRQRADTTSIFQEIEPQWVREGLDAIDNAEGIDQADVPAPSMSEGVTISRHLARLLQRLMEEYRLGLTNQQEQALEMFSANNPEAAKRPELLGPMSREWVELRRWFIRYAHFAVQRSTPPEQELQSKFEMLENYILGLKRTFYEGVEGLDEILEEANS